MSNFSKEENKKLLEIFEKLRVADVRDGLDWIGYHNFGTVDRKVRPLFRTKAVGIARTARYLPYVGPYPNVTGDEYTKWQNEDKRVIKKINNLMKDIIRNGNAGIGHPEPLKGDLSGYWSREIDAKNRLTYKILENGTILIIHCHGHYGDK